MPEKNMSEGYPTLMEHLQRAPSTSKQVGCGGTKRLGRVQKRILLTLLDDEAHQASADSTTPILQLLQNKTCLSKIYRDLGMDIQRLFEFGICDAVTLLRRYRRRIRTCWNAIRCLEERGLVKVIEIEGSRNIRHLLKLTDKGRVAAEKVRREKARLDREEAINDLKKALKALQVQGHTHATLDQIHRILWQTSGHKFNDQEGFNRYWTKQRLGRVLKKEMKLKQVRIGSRKNRKWAYPLGPLCPR